MQALVTGIQKEDDKAIASARENLLVVKEKENHRVEVVAISATPVMPVAMRRLK